MCRTCIGLLVLILAAPGCVGVGPNDTSFATRNGFSKEWLVSSSLPEGQPETPPEKPRNDSAARSARLPAESSDAQSADRSSAEESLEDAEAKSPR
jgi:hypothetical protein